eukprot:TRINITY_DN8246_c0_g1_i1.p3 TRINITY_DN8246_c0_g1~~TRINITY_DN8246_c0_g1_i1.p3  ORF type:complete len:55 (+),score=30.80 TRINITY_DN8246_c0_g1_i1:624-788(+)
MCWNTWEWKHLICRRVYSKRIHAQALVTVTTKLIKKKKYRLRGRSSETAKAHRG